MQSISWAWLNVNHVLSECFGLVKAIVYVWGFNELIFYQLITLKFMSYFYILMLIKGILCPSSLVCIHLLGKSSLKDLQLKITEVHWRRNWRLAGASWRLAGLTGEKLSKHRWFLSDVQFLIIVSLTQAQVLLKNLKAEEVPQFVLNNLRSVFHRCNARREAKARGQKHSWTIKCFLWKVQG